MSQKTNKTPRRTPSIDPNEKQIIGHCRLHDVPRNRKLIGVSFEDDPNTVVFKIGSQNDTSDEFIYASFNEATNYGTFLKYLHICLITCECRPCGKNGVSHIYHGKYDYTILPKDDNENVAGKEHPDGISHKTPMQVQRTRKRGHKVEETPMLPSVSKENVAEEVNLQDSNAEYVTPVSKHQRTVLEPIEETPERSMFTRSEPISAPNYSQTPSLNAEGRDQQPNNDIAPTVSRPSTLENSTELDPDSPSLSARCSPINDSAELEHQQRQLEKITTSWFSCKSSSEEQFISDHMFDTRSKELGLGELGIDPHDVPVTLISHLNPSIFSSTPVAPTKQPSKRITSQSYEVDAEPDSTNHLIHQSFEVDDEPEEEYYDDAMNDTFTLIREIEKRAERIGRAYILKKAADELEKEMKYFCTCS